MRKFVVLSLLAAGLMLLPCRAQSAGRWCAIAGEVEIPLDVIECFISTDGEYCMNIVLDNGMVMSNVPSVSFAERENTGIDEELTGDGDILFINNVVHITRAGSCGMATVMDFGGRMQASSPVVGGECEIDISRLNAGVYILNLGDKSIKFAKR